MVALWLFALFLHVEAKVTYRILLEPRSGDPYVLHATDLAVGWIPLKNLVWAGDKGAEVRFGKSFIEIGDKFLCIDPVKVVADVCSSTSSIQGYFTPAQTNDGYWRLVSGIGVLGLGAYNYGTDKYDAKIYREKNPSSVPRSLFSLKIQKYNDKKNEGPVSHIQQLLILKKPSTVE